MKDHAAITHTISRPPATRPPVSRVLQNDARMCNITRSKRWVEELREKEKEKEVLKFQRNNWKRAYEQSEFGYQDLR